MSNGQHDDETKLAQSAKPQQLSRRFFLLGTGGLATAAAVAACQPDLPDRSRRGQPSAARAGAPHPADGTPNRLAGFVTFSLWEAQMINAIAGRLIPSDELGPGAMEAGVVYFIDRQLSSDLGMRGPEYRMGPWPEGNDNQGDQSQLPIRARYRAGIEALDAHSLAQTGRGFLYASPADQDRLLQNLEQDRAPEFTNPGASDFFDMVLEHVKAGFFADPIHGGNVDMVGWRLIGYPGAQHGYRQHILNYGVPFPGAPQSLAQLHDLA